jgi:hypothetical protein
MFCGTNRACGAPQLAGYDAMSTRDKAERTPNSKRSRPITKPKGWAENSSSRSHRLSLSKDRSIDFEHADAAVNSQQTPAADLFFALHSSRPLAD